MKQTCEVVKVACDKCDGNPHGFYECDTDKVPEGAVIFGSVKTKTVWHAYKIGVGGADDTVVETFNKKKEATGWITEQEEPLTFKADKEVVEVE